MTGSIIEPVRPIQIHSPSVATWRVSSFLAVALREEIVKMNTRNRKAARVEQVPAQRHGNLHRWLNLELCNADKCAVSVPPKDKNGTVTLVELR